MSLDVVEMEVREQRRSLRASAYEAPDSEPGAVSPRSATSDDLADAAERKHVDPAVPFWVAILIVLAVPIGFAAALAGMEVHSVVSATRFMAGHEDVIRAMFGCTTAMMNERGQLSLFASYAPNSPEQLARLPYVHERADVVDRVCWEYHTLLLAADDADVRTTFAAKARAASSLWNTSRSAALRNELSGYVDSERFDAVEDMASVLGVLARDDLARYASANYIQLGVSRSMTNAVGALRATGGYMLSAAAGGVGTPQYREARDAMLVLEGRLNTAEKLFRDVMDAQGTEWYAAYIMSTRGARAALAQLRASNHSFVATTDSLQFFDLFTVALQHANSMALRSGGLVDQATTWDTRQRQLLVAACLLAGALLLSAAAAVALVVQERRAVDKMRRLLQQAEAVNAAVMKYVPKRFMALVGCRSILAMDVDAYTETAVTLVHTEVRDFARMTAEMSNVKLFRWLDIYVGCMTAATESCHGFVDRLVGDTLSTVFTSTDGAVEAAELMHAETHRLNREGTLSSLANSTIALRIGTGIHRSVVAAGVLGDDVRRTTTILSSAMHRARSLQALGHWLGARILISKAAANTLRRGTHGTRRIGLFVLEGHTVDVVEVFRADDERLRRLKASTKDAVEQTILRLRGRDISLATATERLLDLGCDSSGPSALEDECAIQIAENIDEHGVVRRLL